MMTTMSGAAFVLTVLMFPVQNEVKNRFTVDRLKVELPDPRFAEQLQRDQVRLIKALVTIVRDDKNERAIRLKAIRILGDLRAIQAVPTLVHQIDQIIPETIDGKSITSLFPCVPALIRIGKPSSNEVLKELRKPITKTRRLALAVVLGGVEGRAVGRFMLQHEIARAKTPQERRNLHAGLEAFLAMTANERTAEELKADEPSKNRKDKRPVKRGR